jgi:pyridoxine kinase
MGDGILSIQSAVAYGHVGNSAAVFPLQRLGFEVWPVNTVLFSNHTGYGAWRGRVVGLDWVEEIGEAVLRAVARVREVRPDMVYACDPVMGDEGRGFFVRPGIPEFFRDRAVPAADLVTPNQFELAWLAGRTIATVEDALAAAAKVRATGPKVVVCTSLETGGEGELGILADSAEASWLCRTPKLPVTLNGTGDAFTALFLGGWLATGSLDQTLERAVAAMYALVEATHRAGSRELELVAAQDELVAPARSFPAQRLR